MSCLIQNQMVSTNRTLKDVFLIGKKSIRGYIKILYHLLRWQAKKSNFFKNTTAEAWVKQQ